MSRSHLHATKGLALLQEFGVNDKKGCTGNRRSQTVGSANMAYTIRPYTRVCGAGAGVGRMAASL